MSALGTYTKNTSIVEEPQLAVKFYSKEKRKKENKVDKSTLNMLSLFSGCGGMDLGFEGNFSVLKSSVNEILNPNFINEELENNFIKLSKTRFKTVFANDILKDARNAWVNYFSKRGNNAEDYQTDSIVDLVKLHQSGTKIFPANVDIVTVCVLNLHCVRALCQV